MRRPLEELEMLTRMFFLSDKVILIIICSAFGVVREMSGAPLREVRVEALSEQCDQHQLVAMTKDDGSFRIRGLKPGCSYK